MANAIEPNNQEVLINLGVSQVNELGGAMVPPPTPPSPIRSIYLSSRVA
jgi:hypothetical protein